MPWRSTADRPAACLVQGFAEGIDRGRVALLAPADSRGVTGHPSRTHLQRATARSPAPGGWFAVGGRLRPLCSKDCGVQTRSPWRGAVELTQPVFGAWVASGRDPRIAKIFATAAPDPDTDADLGAIAGKLKALAADPKLDALARLYGFTGARA
jgi:hypothetical protein